MDKIKGLIFDLDGVIVDTAKYHFMAWQEISKELGYSFSTNDNELLKGVSRERSFEIILELAGVDMEKKKQAEYCYKKNEIYLQYIEQLTETDILQGVRSFLENARKKDFKIILGSASKNAVVILKALNLMECFDSIIDGTKVKLAKPNPEVFIKGAESMNLANNECIVFEDSLAGIEAALTCGMKPIGIGLRDSLSNADYVIQTFKGTQIEDIISNI